MTTPDPDIEPPTVPGALTATAIDHDSVQLGWTESSDNVAVDSYVIRRDGAQIATIPAGSTTFTDDGATPATTHSYLVTAVDTSNNTATAGPVEATTANAPDTEPPSAPVSLAGAASSPTAVDLTWTSSSDNVAVASYVVNRDGVDIATLPAGAVSYADGNAAAGTTNSYTVTAVDTSGNQAVAGPIDVVTPPIPDGEPPSVPGSFSAVAVSPSVVNLDWDASTDNIAVTSYVVNRDGVDVATIPATITAWTDVGAVPNTTHTYTVTAFDASANSATAGPVDVTTPAPVPDVVAAFDFTEVTPGVVSDLSGNGNDGSLVGNGAVVPSGRFGDAVAFDGNTNATGSVDLGALDVPGSELTIAAWINADDFDTYDARIVSKADGTATNAHHWMLSTFDERLRFRLKTDDGVTTTLIGTANSLSAGTWHFVAATYDGATMRVFVDGVEVGSTTKTGSIAQDPSVDAAIGANPGTASKNFDGRIDELRIQSRALSATELQALALVPVVPPVPDTEDPTAPGSPAGVALGGGSIGLDWTASADNVAIASYVINRDGADIATLPATATAFTDTGLAAGVTYRYTITAVDTSGNTASTGPVDVTTEPPDTESPTAPGAFVGVGDRSGHGRTLVDSGHRQRCDRLVPDHPRRSRDRDAVGCVDLVQRRRRGADWIRTCTRSWPSTRPAIPPPPSSSKSRHPRVTRMRCSPTGSTAPDRWSRTAPATASTASWWRPQRGSQSDSSGPPHCSMATTAPWTSAPSTSRATSSPSRRGSTPTTSASTTPASCRNRRVLPPTIICGCCRRSRAEAAVPVEDRRRQPDDHPHRHWRRVTAGTWHFVAATYDGATMRIVHRWGEGGVTVQDRGPWH